MVGALIAGIEKVPGGIETEAARIIPARPFLAEKSERARLLIHGEEGDAVVQAIGHVDKPAIGREGDLGGEIAAGEFSRLRAIKSDVR